MSKGDMPRVHTPRTKAPAFDHKKPEVIVEIGPVKGSPKAPKPEKIKPPKSKKVSARLREENGM